MRISTDMIYDLGTASLQRNQQELLRLQQQIGTGRRILEPADDPVAAAAVFDVRQSQAVNDQFRINGDGAKSQLYLEETALADITTLLQNAKTLAVYAGNATLSNEDRDSIAVELASNYQHMLSIANSDDGNGQFQFSGFQGATRPFAEISPGNVTYNGDEGQRLVQIEPGRSVATNDTGEAVFRAIRNGNGTFATAAGVGNTGTGIIDTGTLIDPTKWNVAANSGGFVIRFDVTAGITTFDIVDTVNNVSKLTGAAPAAAGPFLRTYVPGGTITLATQSPPDTNPLPFDFGATVAIQGSPQDGDTFSIARSTNQDIFTTLQGLINALRNGMSGLPASSAVYTNAVNSAMTNIDNALDNVLLVRTGVGERLKAIDSAQSSSESLSLQYSQTLSDLEDLDYAKAISDLSLQQTYLQAAQQSFLRLTELSLFDFL